MGGVQDGLGLTPDPAIKIITTPTPPARKQMGFLNAWIAASLFLGPERGYQNPGTLPTSY